MLTNCNHLHLAPPLFPTANHSLPPPHPTAAILSAPDRAAMDSGASNPGNGYVQSPRFRSRRRELAREANDFSPGDNSDGVWEQQPNGVADFRDATLEVAIMDSRRAVWWTEAAMDIGKTERFSTFIGCTYDGTHAPHIALGFGAVEGATQGSLVGGQSEFLIHFNLSRSRDTNRLAAYSTSYNHSALTLVVKKTAYRSAAAATHHARLVAELLENEWEWSGVAVVRLVLKSPGFVRAFQSFVAQHSPPGVEVIEAAINQYISSFHFKIQMGGSGCFGRFEDTINFIAQIFEKLIVQRICPGCAAPFFGDSELFQHFDSSDKCHVKCSCGSNPGTGSSIISSHLGARHTLICPSCEWLGDWLGLQVHLQTRTRCAFILSEKRLGRRLAPQPSHPLLLDDAPAAAAGVPSERRRSGSDQEPKEPKANKAKGDDRETDSSAPASAQPRPDKPKADSAEKPLTPARQALQAEEAGLASGPSSPPVESAVESATEGAVPAGAKKRKPQTIGGFTVTYRKKQGPPNPSHAAADSSLGRPSGHT